MEKTYFCDEQVGQMQATYDAITMLKMLHDAGIDIRTNSMNFYCYGWGDQASIFDDSIGRLFEGCTKSARSDDYGESCEFSIAIPDIEEMKLLSTELEEHNLIMSIEDLLSHECEQFEMKMSGTVKGINIFFELKGSYGIFSPFLSRLIAIKTEILSFIVQKREQLIQHTYNLYMVKMFSLHYQIPKDFPVFAPTAVVFTHLISLCGIEVTMSEAELLKRQDMCSMLGEAIKNTKIGEVA